MIGKVNFQYTHTDVFTSYLWYLGVKHTKLFATRYFNEHPYKYSLFGLAKMLSDFGVENVGIQVEDKKQALSELTEPFIVYFRDSFLIIFKTTPNLVHCLWNNKSIKMPREEFLKAWTGVALIGEKTSAAIEPDYKVNKRKESVDEALNRSLLYAVLVMVAYAFFYNGIYMSIALSLLVCINMIGVFISFLLVKKQMRVQSKYADRICSFFSYNDCNDILESKAAKAWGVFSWSELGLGYFISNVLGIVFMPYLLSYIVMLNVCVLIFSVWSIWHQKHIAKQWCPLCLLVQLLFCVIFIIELFFGLIQAPAVTLNDVISIVSLFFFPFIFIHFLLPVLNTEELESETLQELNSIKAKEDVFVSLLKHEPFYKVDKKTSSILFGNKQADIWITVLTNPHCNPCSDMHKRINLLLEQSGDHLCVQYVFSSFNESLVDSNKALIYLYINKGEKIVKALFDDWFSRGKLNKKEFFDKHQIDLTDEWTLVEFAKHKSWKDNSGISATPTVLVNGYKLPTSYKIEDLRYFEKLRL